MTGATRPNRAADALSMPLAGVNLIEASAGTGKTYTLQHLVLRLVVERGIPLDRILMVTFTKDATAELSTRIRDAFVEALDGVRRLRRNPELRLENVFPDATLRGRMQAWFEAKLSLEERLDTAVAAIDQARIYTIHGFCEKALTEHVLTRHGNLEERFGADAAPLARELVGMFLRRYAERFAKTHRDASDLRERLRALLSCEEDLVECLTQDFQTISDPAQIVPLVVCSGAKDAEESNSETAAAFDKAEMLRVFATEELVHFRQEKAKAGLLTYDDMLMQMREAVRNRAFRDALASEFDAVLIDEFQDTDPLQYEIFRRLFLEGRDEACAPVVIFVGDPKQSIYRFRNAQIETYDAARAAIAPERIRTLSDNHRSAGALVTVLNRVFADVGTTTIGGKRPETVAFQKTQGVSYDASIGALRYERADVTPKLLPEFELWTDFDRSGAALPSRKDSETRHLGLYRALAQDIADLLTHPVYKPNGARLRASDIAVLVRETKHGQAFKRILQREHGLGARIAESSDVFQTEEGAETLCVLRAIANPQDRGRIDEFLVTRLAGASYAEVAIPGSDKVLALRSHLREASDLLSRRGPLAAFGTLMDDCGTVERLLATFDGKRRIANYRHLFELLHAKWREVKTPGALLHWFENERGATGMPPEDRVVRTDDDADLVTIATIHKSKGLEYEVVYCPDLAFDANTSKKLAVLRVPDSKGGYSTTELAVVYGGSSETALRLRENQGDAARARAFGAMTVGEGASSRTLDVKEAIEEAKMREACENVRLGYVAMTRAKRRLVIPVSVRWTTKTMHASSRQNILFSTLVDLTGEEGRYAAENAALSALGVDAKLSYGAAKPAMKAILARLDSLFAAPQPGEQDFVSDAGASSVQELLRWRQIDFGAAADDRNALADGFFEASAAGTGNVSRAAAAPVRIPVCPRLPGRYWEQTSFTSLMRPLAHLDTHADALDDWELLDDEPEEWNAGTPQSEASDLDILPFGNQTGTCLHGLIERFPDWETSAAALSEVRDPTLFGTWAEARHPHHVLYREVARALEASGLAGADEEQRRQRSAAVLRMLRDVLNKTLSAKHDPALADLEGMTLAKAAGVRMAEALFFLEMDSGSLIPKTANDLGHALEPFGYGIDGLEDRSLQGFIKGEIDVVFHWKGRFWILDWKTNRIGSEANPRKRFTRESMHAEIRRHGYQLQYLLYAAALRRMLRQKFPDADPNALMGGALYVFLRGVNDDPEDMSGFYCDPAGKDFIGALDAIEAALGWRGGAR